MGVHEGKLRLRVLTEKDSRAVHQTALKILAGTGMRILDRETVGILTDQGCRVTDDGYVLFDEETIGRALSSVPSRMVLYDRNGEIRIIPFFCRKRSIPPHRKCAFSALQSYGYFVE